MQEDFGPVYEVTHHVDAAIVDEFDAWLAQHVEEMLELPGIVRAGTYATDEDEQGRPRRISRYLFESDTALDEYLEGPAAAMRQVAADRFGDQFDVSRRTLRATKVVDGELKPAGIVPQLRHHADRTILRQLWPALPQPPDQHLGTFAGSVRRSSRTRFTPLAYPDSADRPTRQADP